MSARTTWKPTPDEVRAILTELHPLLHGRDVAPDRLEGWSVPEPEPAQARPRRARHSPGKR